MAASIASSEHTDVLTVASFSMIDYDDKSGCSGFSSEGRRLASIALNSHCEEDDDGDDTVSSSSSSGIKDEALHQEHNTVEPSSESNNGVDVDDEQRNAKPVANFALDSGSVMPELPGTVKKNECHYSLAEDDDGYSEHSIEFSWKNGAPAVKEKLWETPDDFDKLYAETGSVDAYFNSKEKSPDDYVSKKISRYVFCLATVAFAAAIVVLLLSLTVFSENQDGRNGGLRTDAPGSANATDLNMSAPSATSAPIMTTITPTTLLTTTSPTEGPTLGTITPTRAPSAFDGLSRSDSILSFIRNITNATTLDEFPSQNTDSSLSEHRALAWLIEDDPMNLTLTEPVKIAQRFALAAIWYGLNGESWKEEDDWLSDAEECDWFGVTDCTEDGVITGITMVGNGLRGTVPSYVLAALDKLETLKLPNNQLSGPIPAGIAHLSELKSLDLRQNGLTGTIPENLDHCSLLKSVTLQQNKLSGSLPSTLSQLTWMETFLVDFNQVTGTIPSDYRSWTNIRDFRVSSNRLEGTMPSFSSWSYIEMYSIYRNKFVGPLPPDIADDWPLLRTFHAGENEIGGTLPTEYARLTELRHLGVNAAKYVGTIPPQYTGLSNLVSFLCGNNMLTGSIPSALATWSSLDSWSCSGNAISGTLPTTIGNWSSMKVFRMANNRLNGTIPSEISRWTALTEFNVANNDILGALHTSLESLVGMTYFSVGKNPRLRGTIPSTLESWTDLKNATLSGTSFVGSIPWCQSSEAVVDVDCDRFVCECCTCQQGP